MVVLMPLGFPNLSSFPRTREEPPPCAIMPVAGSRIGESFPQWGPTVTFTFSGATGIVEELLYKLLRPKEHCKAIFLKI